MQREILAQRPAIDLLVSDPRASSSDSAHSARRETAGQHHPAGLEVRGPLEQQHRPRNP